MVPPDALSAVRTLTTSATNAGNGVVCAFYLASAEAELTTLERQVSAARLALESAQTVCVTRWHSKGAA
jgi:hypothetical protein